MRRHTIKATTNPFPIASTNTSWVCIVIISLGLRHKQSRGDYFFYPEMCSMIHLWDKENRPQDKPDGTPAQSWFATDFRVQKERRLTVFSLYHHQRVTVLTKYVTISGYTPPMRDAQKYHNSHSNTAHRRRSLFMRTARDWNNNNFQTKADCFVLPVFILVKRLMELCEQNFPKSPSKRLRYDMKYCVRMCSTSFVPVPICPWKNYMYLKHTEIKYIGKTSLTNNVQHRVVLFAEGKNS